ncbi:MAG: protein-L-isoaspartate(D-aspartate) O-methyltransferase [Verrucomicrobiae bacterium]|nr:protein-L-isoaspartate(D-aspartate) O-methyltransferase [Verrucomicrobiae bacterium]
MKLPLMNNATSPDNLFAAARQRLVAELAGPGCAITDARVLAAMNQVPRHEFVPEKSRGWAYKNIALPIGLDQTISQPFIVATMTAALAPQPDGRMLEIGTGCGYQAAVLAQLVAAVYTIEIIEALAEHAQNTLHRLGCRNVHTRTGDGYDGWPAAAPFDGIIVTCAPGHVPAPLIAQLKDGGRLVIPVGPPGNQDLFIFQKRDQRLVEQARFPVRFVPMTGRLL